MNITLNYIMESVKYFGKTARLFFNMDFSAFNAAHVKHVVDKAEQMISGRHDLFKILLDLIPMVNMVYCQRSKAYDSVHRSTNVVGHIGKKYTFCLICSVCLHKRAFKQIFLFYFAAYFFVHASESYNNSANFFPCSRPNRFHLKISYIIVASAGCSVVHMEIFIFSKLFFQPIPCAHLCHYLSVISKHTGVYVFRHIAFQQKLFLASENRFKHVFVAVGNSESISQACIQIVKAHEIVVDTERVDKLCLTLFIFSFLNFLSSTVQKKTLIKHLAVFLQKLYVAHNVQYFSVLMLYAVLHAYVIAGIL